MDTRLAVHIVVLVFMALIVVWGIKIFWSNVRASRENPQLDDDAKVIAGRLKKMLPWAALAAVVLVALNVLPMLLFR